MFWKKKICSSGQFAKETEERKLFEQKIITNREKSYLLTSLIYALDRIANTVGHYDAYRKIDIPEKRLFLLPLDLKVSKYSAEIHKADANELVKKNQSRYCLY